MNWLDIVILIVVGVGVFRGVRRGVILEVFGLAAVGVGISLAMAYHGVAAEHLIDWDIPDKYARFLGFAGVLLLSGGVVLGLGRLTRTFMHATLLGSVDTLLGGVLGLLKGALVAWAFLTFAAVYLPPLEKATEGSWLALELLSVSEQVKDIFPDDTRERLEERLEAVKKVWKELEKD